MNDDVRNEPQRGVLAACCLRVMALAGSLALTLALAAIPTGAFAADTARYTVIFGGQKVGHVFVDTKAGLTTIDYNVKNNGRGPTMAETITFGADGMPNAWSISGTSTFGSKVNERFNRDKRRATWLDSTGKGQAPRSQSRLSTSRRAAAHGRCKSTRARLLKQPGMTMRALPGGTVEAGERRQPDRPGCRRTDTGHALRAFRYSHGARDDVARRRRRPVRVGVAVSGGGARRLRRRTSQAAQARRRLEHRALRRDTARSRARLRRADAYPQCAFVRSQDQRADRAGQRAGQRQADCRGRAGR